MASEIDQFNPVHISSENGQKFPRLIFECPLAPGMAIALMLAGVGDTGSKGDDMKSVKKIAVLGLGVALGAVLLASCAATSGGVSGNERVPEPTKPVDLDRYLGKWYEFARYENRFERGCEAVTAEYGKRPDGLISVLNVCQQGRVGGEQRSSTGRAKVTPGSNNARLRVSFFGPFWGDYWVLDHADDYSWSIVGEPSGKYLWILTREPKPTEPLSQMLLARARSLGYDTTMLRLTQH